MTCAACRATNAPGVDVAAAAGVLRGDVRDGLRPARRALAARFRMIPGPAVKCGLGWTVVRGGKPVLDRLSVDVPARAVTGLLGPSGCGKTTLMRAIVGVQIVAGGRVTVLGAGRVAAAPPVGYIAQAPSVYADLSVEENLRYFAAIVGGGPGARSEVLETVGLGPPAGQVVGHALRRRALAGLACGRRCSPAPSCWSSRSRRRARPGAPHEL